MNHINIDRDIKEKKTNRAIGKSIIRKGKAMTNAINNKKEVLKKNKEYKKTGWVDDGVGGRYIPKIYR